MITGNALSEFLQTENIKEACKQLVTKLIELNKLKKISLVFEKKQNLLIKASSNIDKRVISLNLNLINALETQKIDFSSKDIYNFKFNQIADIDLKNALKWTIENRGDYINTIVSHNLLKQDLIVTLLHEVQHFLQHKYSGEGNSFYQMLINLRDISIQDKPFNLSTSPIEIDAIYESITCFQDFLKMQNLNTQESDALLFNAIPFEERDVKELREFFIESGILEKDYIASVEELQKLIRIKNEKKL